MNTPMEMQTAAAIQQLPVLLEQISFNLALVAGELKHIADTMPPSPEAIPGEVEDDSGQ